MERVVVERGSGARVAVVGRQHNRRVVVALRPLQLLEQAADDRVGGAGINLQEQEVPLARLRLYPLVRCLECREAITLRQYAFVERLVRNRAVIEREPLRETRGAPQEER